MGNRRNPAGERLLPLHMFTGATRNYGSRLPLIMAKLETKVGRLRENGAIVVFPLPLAHDGFIGPLVEACYGPGLTQVVFDDSPQGGGDIVLTRYGELNTLLPEQFKCPEQDTANQQNHR